MSDLRVKATIKGASSGNGKTVSKKAIKSGRASTAGNTPHGNTPRNSPFASLLTSPAHSAAPSRQASDWSDNDFDYDAMSASTGSNEFLEVEDETDHFDPQLFISALQDRKHHNTESREGLLEGYIRNLRCSYKPTTHEWLDDLGTELTEIFLRLANRGMTARERLLSLQAFTLTLATTEEADVYEQGHTALKQMIRDEDDEECEVFGLYSLAFGVLYGGGSEEGAQELLDYLAEIISSDGDKIESHNNALVLTGALQSWLFVASHVEDLSDAADLALDAFVDHLDSDDTDVQIHAAYCIALIFEASRNHEADVGEPFSLSYDPQRLVGRMHDLIRQTKRSVSKKNRKTSREAFTSVITSLERSVGPGYSTAGFAPDAKNGLSVKDANDDGYVELGYRLKLRLGNQVARIETWTLFSRVNMIKLLFGSHLQRHMFVNPVVSECLSDADFTEYTAPPKSGPKALKRPVPKGGKR
ncbi:interferon-related developmental regulator-domain-containing protein [Thelonectria olida]|uniref:Interferon-related developmental regulator-domain-containing protein n=1 Tax=Thelonectria olida TaxID=1576542 RepID=A0A9P8WGY2_9HYPO|nr:interferon-related developmental regulator-domain-containing protein [Thelonectria olida]